MDNPERISVEVIQATALEYLRDASERYDLSRGIDKNINLTQLIAIMATTFIATSDPIVRSGENGWKIISNSILETLPKHGLLKPAAAAFLEQFGKGNIPNHEGPLVDIASIIRDIELEDNAAPGYLPLTKDHQNIFLDRKFDVDDDNKFFINIIPRPDDMLEIPLANLAQKLKACKLPVFLDLA